MCGTITNANYLSVLFHPASLLLILLFLVMAVFYTVFDVNAMVLLSTDVFEGRRRGVFELIREAVRDLRLFRTPSGFLLILYIVFARPFTGGRCVHDADEGPSPHRNHYEPFAGERSGLALAFGGESSDPGFRVFIPLWPAFYDFGK